MISHEISLTGRRLSASNDTKQATIDARCISLTLKDSMNLSTNRYFDTELVRK
jgi:hypothetical protein